MEFTSLRTNNPLLSGFEQDVEKAHVKSYTRTAKSGKMSMVKEHDDKRTKKVKKENPKVEYNRSMDEVIVTYRGHELTYQRKDYEQTGLKNIVKKIDEREKAYEKWKKKKDAEEKKKDMRKPLSHSQIMKNRENEEKYDDEVESIGWQLTRYSNEDLSRKKKIAKKTLDIMNKYGLTLEELCERFTEIRREARRVSGARHSSASLDVEDDYLKSVMQLGKITKKPAKKKVVKKK